MEFELAFHTSKHPTQVIESIDAALKERGFSILFNLNITAKLAEKGLSLDSDVHILEVCNARKAKEAIETNPLVTYFLPCKIVVSSRDGRTIVGLARPTMLMSILGDERMKELAEEVENTLVSTLKEVVNQTH